MPISPENTIDIWINALHHYDLKGLHAKPDKESWSLGQVYMHIIEDTTYYIEQAETCLAHAENPDGLKTEFGAALFTNNSFPDERIAGDTHLSQAVPQPISKNELLESLIRLKARLTTLWEMANGTHNSGKTKHPGMGYFNALEWIRFAEIHMRHHLRQKARIEEALKRAHTQP